MKFIKHFPAAIRNVQHSGVPTAQTRRGFLGRMGSLGVCAAIAGLLFAGCGGGDSSNNNSQPYSNTLGRANSQMKAVIQKYLALNPTPIYNLPPAEARVQPSIKDAVNAVLTSQGKTVSPPVVGNVQDTTIPGPAGPLMARVYTPAGVTAGSLPVVVYFHGGGWVIGSIDVYDNSCRALANASKSLVISVEYRKGPENKFPAAHEDAYAATQYVLNNTAQFGGDPSRVATAGESAGGNMASAVCLLARDRGGKMPVYQVLVYPVAGNNMNTASYIANANAVPLSKPAVQYFLNNYLASPSDANSPLLNLVGATLDKSLPPATVITDDIDPLMSEGQQYASLLQNAGITVRARNYAGVTHEFFGTGLVVDEANDAVQYAADGLNTVFKNR